MANKIEPKKLHPEMVADSIVKGGLAGSFVATINVLTHDILMRHCQTRVPTRVAIPVVIMGSLAGSSLNLTYNFMKEISETGV